MGQIACFRTGFRELEGKEGVIRGKIGRENGEGNGGMGRARFGDGRGMGQNRKVIDTENTLSASRARSTFKTDTKTYLIIYIS